MDQKSQISLIIRIAILLQLWINLPVTNSEFCDSHRDIQRIACTDDEGCVYAVRATTTSWVEGQTVCDCHGMHFSDVPHKVQLAIDAAPKNFDELLWLSGSKTDILPCGFTKGLTKAEPIVCQSFESGVFLWMVQAFYTQKHRGGKAIPICRRDGCSPIDVRFCIHFGNETDNWYDARNHCLLGGGDLFYLTQTDNDNFFQFILTFLNILATVQQIGQPVYWSGIRYEDWYWQATGDVKLSNWAQNEPRYNDDYDCMAMNMTTGKWVTMPCKYKFGVMCRDHNITVVTRPTTTTTTSTTTTTARPSTTKTSSTTSSTTTTKTTANATEISATTDEVTEQLTTEPIVTTVATVEETTAKSHENGSNASVVSLPVCIRNSGLCSALPAVLVIFAVAVLVIGLFVCLRKRRKPEEEQMKKFPVELTHAPEEDFSGLQGGARAAENIYVDPLKGGLQEDEGIYDEIGKKPGFEEDEDYDDAGSIKKPPLDDDDDDFDSLKKPHFNHAFEDDLKKH